MTPELIEVNSLFFEPFIDKAFLVNSLPAPLPIILRAVQESAPPYWPKEWRKPFLLIFETPRSRLMQEGIYEVYGEGFGPLSFYINPIITVDRAIQHYQAAFN